MSEHPNSLEYMEKKYMKEMRKLGDIVELIDERNKSLESSEVLGISIDKEFMPSVANTIGTDLSNYKLLRMNTFACNPMHVGRDERLPVSLYKKNVPAIVSPAYFMFRVKDENKVLPDFLMLIFKRENFDRNCWFRTDGSVRGGITWNDICEIELPVPDLKEQEKIVNTYNAITKRIQLKQKINDNLEKMAECLFDKIWESDECIEVELSELADLTSSKRVFFDEYVPEGIPFYRGGEITEKRQGFPISNPLYITEESYNEKIEKYGVPNAGDILITAVGTIGNSYMVTENDKFYFKDGNLIWFRNFKNNSNYIIYDFLNSKQFKKKIEQISIGSTQTALTISGLSKIKIKIPNSINYQRYIEQSKVIQKSIQQNNTELENLYYLKNILISQISKR